MAVFSTSERKLRPRGDRKSIEVNQNLKQIFESAILVNLYPSQQIDIYIEVNIVMNVHCFMHLFKILRLKYY